MGEFIICMKFLGARCMLDYYLSTMRPEPRKREILVNRRKKNWPCILSATSYLIQNISKVYGILHNTAWTPTLLICVLCKKGHWHWLEGLYRHFVIILNCNARNSQYFVLVSKIVVFVTGPVCCWKFGLFDICSKDWTSYENFRPATFV